MQTPCPILQTDPRAGYLRHREEIDAAIRRVLDSGWFILGPEVAAFEAEFAAFAGTAHAVGVANGTDALVLALEAMGVRPGDRVATVSHTAVATVAAIEIAGAVPVLVDVDEACGMDPAALEATLADCRRDGAPVKAVVPVHLYGLPVDLDTIRTVAERQDVPVLEDASQAHGALWRGAPVGSLGMAGAFSLYPTKNLGALGDGGVLTTDDADLAARLRSLRQYGWSDRYVSDAAGRNSRLDEIQAAVLRVKLAHLPAENARRREIAAAYDQGLRGLPFSLPRHRPGATHVFHQYVVEAEDRDALREALKRAGVATNVHYPVPVHLQPAYRGRLRLCPGGLPRTERLAGRILSLPMHAHLDDDAVARVVFAVRAVMADAAVAG